MRFVSSLKIAGLATAIALAGCATTAIAQEPAAAAPAATAADDGYPLVGGDFWEITAIDLKPGGGLAYANHLATQWRAGQEFAKSKGWIKDYMVMSNYYNRAGEPDLYLISVIDHVPSGPEGEAQFVAYRAWAKSSAEKLQAESADRAEFREIMSNSLLQEMTFR
ncbi:hypothetical protein [Hyphomonas johnsonii]|nr:hypothetical protein [Hyphomonas johnsonii]